MRRWIAIVLLVLLPFQFAWAGAGHWCVHADDIDGPWTTHAAAAADDAQAADGPAQASSLAGCDFCACHAVALVGAQVAGQAHVLAAPAVPAASPPIGDAEPAQPERPQWACLA